MDMQYIGIVYDVLFAALLIGAALLGRSRGFVSGLVALVGSAAGVVAGVYATRAWAQPIYTNYLGVRIGENVTEAMEKAGGDLTAALDSVPFLPQAARDTLTGLLGTATENAVPQIVNALQPLILPFIQAAVFLLVWAAVRLLARLLTHLLRGINAVPFLGGLNRSLGFAFGAVSGILNCWVLSILLWVAANLTGGKLEILTTGALNKSAVYRLLANFNPFLTHY